jgi:hypothetical protein
MVEELNKAGNAIRTARFAASEVISAIEGHEQLTRTKKRG